MTNKVVVKFCLVRKLLDVLNYLSNGFFLSRSSVSNFTNDFEDPMSTLIIFLFLHLLPAPIYFNKWNAKQCTNGKNGNNFQVKRYFIYLLVGIYL